MSKKFTFSANGFDDFQKDDTTEKIDTNDSTKFPKNTVLQIPTELIEIGDNIRDINANDELALNELGASIKEYGQIEPCVVYPHGEKFILKVGSRRFRACLDADIPTLKCIIEENFEDERERIIKQAIENEHRKDMSPREREAYMASLLKLGMSQMDIARALHKGKGWVSEALKAYRVREKNKDLFGLLKEEPPTRDVYNVSKLKQEELRKIIQDAKEHGGTKKEFKRALDARTKNKVRVLTIRYKLNEESKVVTLDMPIDSTSLEWKVADSLESWYIANGYKIVHKATPAVERISEVQRRKQEEKDLGID